MLEITQLTKKFGGKSAVSDVSFTIARGEIFSLIGPNSAGKTTIVRSIAGLLRIDDGTISVSEKNIVSEPIATKAMIGYIPDEPSAWSGMTGGEFLHFVGALYGMSPQERHAAIEKLLPVFALEELQHDFFENYSRGNKQKFSIIAALMHKPKLLLVDEPIVGLDPDAAIIAKRLFTDFKKEGGAVLLVTHTLPVAEEIADRIGVLSEGKLVASGTLAELRSKAKLPADASLEHIYQALASHS